MLAPLSIGFNPSFSLSNKDTYSDYRIDKLFAIVKVRTLRFPGGTTANFFDWKTETLKE